MGTEAGLRDAYGEQYVVFASCDAGIGGAETVPFLGETDALRFLGEVAADELGRQALCRLYHEVQGRAPYEASLPEVTRAIAKRLVNGDLLVVRASALGLGSGGGVTAPRPTSGRTEDRDQEAGAGNRAEHSATAETRRTANRPQEAADSATSSAVRAGRAAYEREVRNLGRRADDLRRSGADNEQIARTLHAERRALGVKYKHVTPEPLRTQIYQRNIERYGDRLGPSIEWLRGRGKSWEDIIESACRPGGKDIF